MSRAFKAVSKKIEQIYHSYIAPREIKARIPAVGWIFFLLTMMSGANNPCYPNRPPYRTAGHDQETVMPPPETHHQPTSFLYNLSILKDRVHQVQSLASIFLPSDDSTATIACPTMKTLIQEIIVTASTMMFACQQISLRSAAVPQFDNVAGDQHPVLDQWYSGDDYNSCSSNGCKNRHDSIPPPHPPTANYDIIELAAADILAKYTHYCQVCDKGFKRDANLRMHMRAHGDEYKSSAALSNPMKGGGAGTAGMRKYSCPQEGCRWNKNHVKFQPLKSMICVKNHYKRSHCPKMYVCKRCNRKQFSVLSDLRTHEKHCGDLKWQCSCGTTFSRKDKLMGHISLFIGHTPASNSLSKMGQMHMHRTS